MADFLYLMIVLVFFAVAGSFTRGCERLLED